MLRYRTLDVETMTKGKLVFVRLLLHAKDGQTGNCIIRKTSNFQQYMYLSWTPVDVQSCPILSTLQTLYSRSFVLILRNRSVVNMCKALVLSIVHLDRHDLICDDIIKPGFCADVVADSTRGQFQIYMHENIAMNQKENKLQTNTAKHYKAKKHRVGI